MPSELHDNVSRRKSPSRVGRAVFVGLRFLDTWWQHRLLTQGWAFHAVQRIGGQPVQLPSSGSLPPYYVLVSLLALGSSLKQNATMLFVSEQETPIGSAIMIAFFNTVFNTANTLLAAWAVTSQFSPALSGEVSLSSLWANSPLVAVGLSAYVVGLLTELVSEFQRRAFKKNPANKGKPYGGGLFSLATNINYGGYTIWRAGYALVTGGLPAAVVTFGFFFYDFVARGVPVMEKYLTERYGDAYKEIQRRVGYKLIPGIY